jgi:transcriptional regulator with GAF, ATPase, and Fis domain
MRDQTPEAAETRLNRLLNYILETSVDVLGFDAVTVTARHEGALSTVAATDQRLVAVDEAQYAANEGPCLAVLDAHDPILISKIGDEARWPQFTETAQHFGVEASLSVHVPVEIEDVAASMNFYARRPMTVTDHLVSASSGFARQVADSMAAVEEYRATATLAHHLSEAMKSRAVIEQAKGILIADHGIDADEAFAMLVRLSQRTNTKVRDVAQRLVDGRQTPDSEGEPPDAV